jgi:hypothetical protein
MMAPPLVMNVVAVAPVVIDAVTVAIAVRSSFA